MLEKIAEDTTLVGGGVAAIIAIAMYLRKLFKGMGLEEARQSGEHAVIKTLRDEVDRLAQTNTAMSRALSDLQLEIIKLRNENISLTGEIGALRNENVSLTHEVLKLNAQITSWGEKCVHCLHKVNEDNL